MLMRQEKISGFGRALALTVGIAALFFFYTAVRDLDDTAREKGREQLEEALRRAAVACYAAEGIYPPDTGYLCEHYGVQVDGERYLVDYEIFADNLMPAITVLEKEP